MNAEDHDTLLRIEENLGGLCKLLLDNGQPGLLTKHDNRLKSLENWRAFVKGALSLAYILLGFAVTLGSVALARALAK